MVSYTVHAAMWCLCAAAPAPSIELDCSIKKLAWEYSQSLLLDPFHITRNASKHVFTALGLARCPEPWNGASTSAAPSPQGRSISYTGHDFYVSPHGSDGNPGTHLAPFATLMRAQKAARVSGPGSVVNIAAGRYELNETFILTPADTGTTYTGEETGGGVVLSGGRRMADLRWRPSSTGKAGGFEAALPDGLDFRSLFVDGVRQTPARFPNGNAETSLFPHGCVAFETTVTAAITSSVD